MSTKIRCVLHLEPLSESLRYRVHLDDVAGQPLLRWWAERLAAMPAVGEILVVCHGDQERARVDGVLDGRARAITTGHFSERRTMAEIARESKEAVLAIVSLGFALAPRDLLRRAAAHHQEGRNTLTAVAGLPAGTTPVLVEREFLLWLDECGLPALPVSVEECVGRLVGLEHDMNVELPIPVRAQRLPAGRAYGAQRERLPREVFLRGPQDVDTLRQVVAGGRGADAGPLEALEAWKQQRIRERATRLEALEPALTPPSRSVGPRRTRVVYVSNASAFSGAEQSLCQMVEKLDSTRFDKVALVGLEGTFAEALRESGASVVVRAADFGRANIDNVLYAVSTLRRLQPDVVHLNAPDASAVAAAAKLLGLPVVLHVRNGAMGPYGDFVPWSDALITVSDFLKREILAFDVPADRVETIYDEVDPDYFKKGVFDREAVRRELGIPADARVALMIARIVPNKRYDLMLRAAARARKKVRNLHLVLKGEVFSQRNAELYGAIQQQAKELGLTDAITWLRFVPDIRALHAAADALVLCSDREGLGRCVVEAMSMELPVVVTDSGGSHELVEEGRRGYSVRGGDAKDLAAKLVRALTRRDEAARLARAARRFAVAELSAQAAADRVAALYDRLLAQRPERSAPAVMPETALDLLAANL